MVKAELVLEGGFLKSCRISGHAGAGKQGTDIVCAAVSVLAKTAFKILSEREGLDVWGEAPERGKFRMEIDCPAHAAEDLDFLGSTGVFLMEGLLSVSEEYPDFCTVKIERRN